MTVTTAIFVGPSLPNNQITEYLSIKADIFPPIKRDDLLNLPHQYTTLAIIDGVFHGDLSVSAREILLSLRENIKIYGCSSMGALRAAELEKFGMIGIGEIFNLYLKREITSDGEVALLFDPITYTNLTVPLVNVRYGIHHAAIDKIINPQQKEIILDIAKKIHYTELDYQFLAHLAAKQIDEKTLNNFLTYVEHNQDQLDLKKKDAIELVSKLNQSARY